MGKLALLYIISFAASALFGFMLMPRILDYCKKKRLYDLPNGRKVHKEFVPRLGGLSFMPSMFVAFLLVLVVMAVQSEGVVTLSLSSVSFLAGLLIIYITGLIDDIIGLKPLTKLIMQIVGASTLPVSSLYFNDLYGFCGITRISPVVGILFTVFFIVYIINAFNFIDGIDGLSGCLSLIVLVGLAGAFAEQELYFFVILIMALMGAISSFLYFNIFGDTKKNTKVFMGDSGSMTLGFVISYLCIKYSMHNYAVMPFRDMAVLLPFSLVVVPVFDVVRVSYIRARNHKPIFGADKNHIHHKLMEAGCSQHVALCIICILAVFFVFVDMFLRSYLTLTPIVAIDVAIWIVFHMVVNRFLPKK